MIYVWNVLWRPHGRFAVWLLNESFSVNKRRGIHSVLVSVAQDIYEATRFVHGVFIVNSNYIKYYIYLTWLDLTWSWFYFSTAAVCPSSWGRQQAANTSNTWSLGGSVLWIDATTLQAFMSAFTQSDHVFLGLPRAFEHGTSILMTDLIQDEDRTTCPYHLRRLERWAAVTSCIPILAHNKSMEISSCGFTPQIHWTILK